ncbi:hypothetical protein QE152_g26104 [Popillia japonica]|uniref:Uncharacterized protein n=1 Tax=Popillia japonica TaxID=7064 RepID=A0AAW1JYW9_POPJA
MAKRLSMPKLAIPELKGVSGVIWARIVGCLFGDGNAMVKMYRSHKGVPRSGASGACVRNTVTSYKQQRRPKQDALLVSMKGKTYADLLKAVREKINPSSVGVD